MPDTPQPPADPTPPFRPQHAPVHRPGSAAPEPPRTPQSDPPTAPTESQAAQPPRRRRGGRFFTRGDGWPEWLDSKAIVAVLIGLVSVTGAIVTWRAALLGEQATDHDRRSIIETALQQQSRASVETQIRAEEEAFARYKALTVAADDLDEQATALREDGFDDAADGAEDRARQLREEADDLASLKLSFNRLSFDDETSEPTYDLDGRRRDLVPVDDPVNKVNPRQTIADGDDFRERSQRLVGWIIVLVAAVVILTIAQISRRDHLRPWIAAVGSAVWLFATVAAFAGDKA